MHVGCCSAVCCACAWVVAVPCVGGGPVRHVRYVSAGGGDIACVAFAFFTRCGLFLRSALLPNAVNGSSEYFTLLIEEAIL